MKEPRIMLAGGGNAADSAPLDRVFTAWTGQGARLLYLPVATDGGPRDYELGLRWLKSVFVPLGLDTITMWTTLDGRSPGELNAFDSIYVGGGNTFRLMSLLRETGFDTALTEYFHAGGAIYGTSAGAIVMGHNVLTAAGMDPNDVALTDTRGLDLVQGHSVWCHYTEEEDEAIYDYLEKYGFPVLALSERAGVGLEGERMIAWGHEPVYRFTRKRKRAIPPGEQV